MLTCLWLTLFKFNINCFIFLKLLFSSLITWLQITILKYVKSKLYILFTLKYKVLETLYATFVINSIIQTSLTLISLIFFLRLFI